MQKTIEEYRRAIQAGQINPLIHWDGRSSGLLLDSQDPEVPLSMLDFGVYCLEDGPFSVETGEREFAFVPVEGQFEVRVGSEVYSGSRQGGPFATLPGQSNASAIYVPADAVVQLQGAGEMSFFSAPAKGSKPPAFVRPGDRENVVRGSGCWLREVVTLFTPEDVSTVLVGGETYSPPGLWSGTPLHVHDLDDPHQGQSDHEEVYYHLARVTDGRWGPFGLQMLFDDEGLDQSYVIHDHDAFAIPGAAHPVVAGPNSDMLYVWALAGPGEQLAMYDVPEFSYLKKVGAVIDQLAQSHQRPALSRADFERIVSEQGLTGEQVHVLRMHLRQQGHRIEG